MLFKKIKETYQPKTVTTTAILMPYWFYVTGWVMVIMGMIIPMFVLMYYMSTEAGLPPLSMSYLYSQTIMAFGGIFIIARGKPYKSQKEFDSYDGTVYNPLRVKRQ